MTSLKTSSVLKAVTWSVALACTAKLLTAMAKLPRLPHLHDAAWEAGTAELPSLIAIVPARNEAADIAACLTSLAAQGYPALQVVAVNDRSTDQTGEEMARVAALYPGRVHSQQVQELPSGWLGKTHAMAMAAASTASDLLFFTDADVEFAPDTLSRAVRCLLATGADHLVLMPTTAIHRWDEGALLGLLQILGLFAVPLWQVPDSRSRHALGVGAFCLVRRTAYESVGGFEALRMEVVEDLTLGRRLKQHGYTTQVALGRDLVRLHWASGAAGIVGVMTKNTFAAASYRVSLILIGCGSVLAFGLLPFAGLCLRGFRAPSALAVLALTGLYWRMQRYSGISPANTLLTPFAALTLVFSMLRSTALTLKQGGIVWRGTFYPLEQLRQTPRLSEPQTSTA